MQRASVLSYRGLQQALPGYTPPPTKAVAMTARWDGYTFSSYNYLLVDRELPPEAARIFGRRVTLGESLDLAAWLYEVHTTLATAAKVQVCYVAYFHVVAPPR